MTKQERDALRVSLKGEWANGGLTGVVNDLLDALDAQDAAAAKATGVVNDLLDALDAQDAAAAKARDLEWLNTLVQDLPIDSPAGVKSWLDDMRDAAVAEAVAADREIVLAMVEDHFGVLPTKSIRRQLTEDMGTYTCGCPVRRAGGLKGFCDTHFKPIKGATL